MAELAEALVVGEDGRPRCWWPGRDELYLAYHDEEWGRPVADDHRLFEKVCLEGFQSGLSWITILRKREHFRRAFAGFDPAVVAAFGDDDVDRLLADAGIVRHRAKILAAITNARRFLELVPAEFPTFAAYVWGFEPDPAQRPPRIDHATLMTLAQTDASRALSRDLRRRGWAFVGPTTAYAAMQSVGLVNDHLEGCAIRDEVERDRAAFVRPAP